MSKRNKELRLTERQQILAATNLNLARDIAWKYQRSTNIEYLILESAAFEGLCQAAARFDPELINEQTGRAMKFSSLAVPYIRGSILHYIRDRTYSMRLTHRMRETWVKGRRMLNRGMTDIEICEELEIDLREWQDTKSACSGPPLELKDQANPTEALEPDEVDCLTPFRGEAAEAISRMSDVFKVRFVKYCKSRAAEPPKTIREELAKYVRIG
jgi:RNA polymerase sigma-B factor